MEMRDAAFAANGGLEYYPYRFGRSGLVFRGPRRRPPGRYVVIIGGSETYGKFVREPYPDQLEAILGLPVVNYGCMHASVGIFAEDDTVLTSCEGADVTVIQVMGAVNNSNRLYTVHPRRNDRFLKASSALRDLYPDVDFTQFNFTRHLLNGLARRSPEAFVTVQDELRQAWIERMRLLIHRIGGRILLLWMSNRPPEGQGHHWEGQDPLMVDRAMLNTLRSEVCDIVEVVASNEAQEEGLENKVFTSADRDAAAEVPGAQFHLEAALGLSEALIPLLEEATEEEARAEIPPQPISQPVRAFR